MIERYNEKTRKMEFIEDGAPTLKIAVFYNGAPNGDIIEATLLTRDYNPCYDTVIMPKCKPNEIYPDTCGWMFDGRYTEIGGTYYKVFDRCEHRKVYDALSR